MAITVTDIHNAADTLVSKGKRPTLTAIRAELGTGSFSTISEALKTWKEHQLQQTQVVATAPESVGHRAAELATQVWLIAQEEAERSMQLERATMQEQRQELEAKRAEAIEAADAAVATQEMLQEQLEATKNRLDTIEQQIAVLKALLKEATTRAERAEDLANAARTAETEARETAAKLYGRLEALEAVQERAVEKNNEKTGTQMCLKTT